MKLDDNGFYPETRESRQKLEKAFELFCLGGRDPDGDGRDIRDVQNGVATVMREMQVATRDDATIVWSAIFSVLIGDDSTEGIHPYSQPGMDLQEAMGMFAWLAIKHVCDEMGVDDWDLHVPNWID